MIRIIFALTLTLAFAAPARAGQLPVWSVAADQITVISTGSVNGLTFATVRDGRMRRHNVYSITVGAHIGRLTVVSITANGIDLSNGRVLPIEGTGLLSQTSR
jgi:hypothetical protein